MIHPSNWKTDVRRNLSLFVLATLLLTAGCAGSRAESAPLPSAPQPAQAAEVASGDTFTRPLLREIPIPSDFRAALDRRTRSATGAPGGDYWQQEVSYSISAELDPGEALLRGEERIVYQNNSPHTLSSIVFNLYQNVYSEGVPRNRSVPVTGGITLERVAAQGQELSPADDLSVGRDPQAGGPAGYVVNGTLARLALPQPIGPGESAVLELAWNFKVPPEPTFRTAWEDALGGRVLHVAQWYPQVATFDDWQGWDATPYLGDGEFYLEYGDFEVALTLPEGWLVGATGTLTNPEEVLTTEALRRLDSALSSNEITSIVTEADLAADNATQMSPDGQLTWRFSAQDVRDFAFATSNRYLWDATAASVGGSADPRTVLVHAFYRPGAPNWENAARYGQHALTFFDDLRTPYIYPRLSIMEGPIGGMEYPALVFIGRPSSEQGLYGVIAHEIGHEWFPMMVGSNEAAYAWMDEGLITYHEGMARADFWNVPEVEAFEGDLESYLRVAGTPAEVPLMRHTDLVTPYGARGVAAYTKPGVLTRALREVMGTETFDRAMDTYAQEWFLKHPAPWDFFNTMERFAGRDLDWFFYPWWFETGILDQAITGVETTASGDILVTIDDLGEVPVPSRVLAITAAGDSIGAEVPIDVWLGGVRSAVVRVETTSPIVEVVLDPRRIFPDVDLTNNVWRAASRP